MYIYNNYAEQTYMTVTVITEVLMEVKLRSIFEEKAIMQGL